jgi:WD40 repeat protein
MFNEKFVVSSSDDGTVKLWSAETGEFIRNLLTLESGGRGGIKSFFAFFFIILFYIIFYIKGLFGELV